MLIGSCFSRYTSREDQCCVVNAKYENLSMEYTYFHTYYWRIRHEGLNTDSKVALL